MASATAAAANNRGIWIDSVGDNTIGGTTAASRNVIAGNTTDGVYIVNPGAGIRSGGVNILFDNSGSATVTNNLIGFANSQEIWAYLTATNLTITNNEIRGNGSAAFEWLGGVDLDGGSNDLISGNLITGNAGPGVNLTSTTSTDTVSDNTISLNGSGNNITAGVQLAGGQGGTISNNIIEANVGAGVLVANGVSGVTISQNSIYGNGAVSGEIGIDLLSASDNQASGTPPYVTLNDPGDADSGGNDLKNFPVLSTATVDTPSQVTITGSYNSLAVARSYRIEFFASSTADPSGYGQGQRYLGFVDVTTDVTGNATFSAVLNASVTSGDVISATATDLTLLDTSEFSQDIVAGNQAPVLNGANNLTSINENPSSNPGTLVSSLISGQVTDADPGALSGIAVTAVDNTNGAWQYSTNGGTTWTAFGAPSQSAALLLAADANTYVRFVPNNNWSGTDAAGLTFQAWDQTIGVAGRTIDVAAAGGGTPFSSNAAAASIIVNAAPTVATAASATPSPVTGTTTALSVLGADDGGEANLTYTWATTGSPPAAVNFSANGTNAAKNATATFTQAGNYSFQVTITDAGGLSTTSNVNVTVNQTLTSITVTPGSATLNENAAQQFAATGYDQFGNALTSQPSFTWAMASGVGSINASGLYTAPGATGSASITATSSAVSGSASINVINSAPTGASNTVTTFENAAYTFTAADFGFSDPNDSPPNNLLAVKITTLPGAGALQDNGVNVTAGQFVSVTDINGGNLVFTPAANASGAGYANFTFQVQDDGGTANGGVDLDPSPKTMTVNVAYVNQPPVNHIPQSPAGGGALYFDGTNNLVDVSPSASLVMTNAVTIEAWVDPTAIPSSGAMIVNKEGEYEMAIAADGQLEYAFANTSPGWNWTETGYQVPVNQWTHVAVTYDNGAITAYANGSAVYSFSGSGTIGDTHPADNDLSIGGRQDSTTQRFQGLIDEVQVWNVARTQLQIDTDMNGQLAGNETGLVGDWRFDELSGLTAIDQSQYHNDGTLGGGGAATPPARVLFTTTENGVLTLSSANNNAISVTDPDAGSASLQTSLSVNNGTLTLAETSGLTVTGNGSGDIVLTGSQTNITTALDGLLYTPTHNFYGSDTLTITTDDLGHSGAGGAQSATNSMTLSVTYVNQAPTVAVAAAATPSPVTGTTTALSVLGADDGGEANLTYTWATTGTPPAPVSFSANGTNAAKDATATFAQAGNYSFQVTITDAGGLSTTSSVNVTVNQTLTSITVTPGSPTLNENAAQQFTATANDQFGGAMSSQPSFTWSQVSGIGAIDAAGLYTAPAAAGAATIAASSGGISGTASVTVNHLNQPPTLTLPGPQNAGTGLLVFSQAAGNQIVVQDVAVGTAPVEVTLAADFGQITLASVQNLTQVSGNGTSSIVIRGSLTAVNAAMNGMQYRPSAPSATLTVTANDLGNAGGGGPQTASGAIVIAASLPTPTGDNDDNNNGNNNDNGGPTSGNTPVAQPPSSTPDNPTDKGSTPHNGPPVNEEPNTSGLPPASRHFVQAARTDGGFLATTQSGVTLAVPMAAMETIVAPEWSPGAHGDRGKSNVAVAFAGAQVTLSDMQTLWNQLDHWKDERRLDDLSWWHIGSVAGLTTAGSLGVLIWCLRGSSLIASALSVLPVWANFDPLPVLDLSARNAREDEKPGTVETDDNSPDEKGLEVLFQ